MSALDRLPDDTPIKKCYIHHTFTLKQDHIGRLNMSDNELDTTIDQWRAALSDIVQNDPGETVAELRARLGGGKTAIRDMLETLIKNGKCKKGRAARTRCDGVRYFASVYQLVHPKKEKKR